MPSEPASNAGIVTDRSGERHIPESVRADGTTRKAIKVKPGYRPPEDVEVYKNRTAKSFQERKERVGIPGASGLKDEKEGSAAANKNAKRREARKKAKANEDEADGKSAAQTEEVKQQEAAVDPEVEKEKKARNLKKKLKQAKELKDRKEEGQSLLPEQIAKIVKINELVRELEALGFDSEGAPKEQTAKAKGEKV